MTLRTIVVLVAAAACQRSQEPPRERVAPAPQTPPAKSIPGPPPASTTREPVPPLPDPLPGVRVDLTAAIGSALRAGIGDLDGDGKSEIVIVDATRMRVLDPSGRELASTAIDRGIQQLVVADLDGDKRAEVIAGWGVTREHMETKAAFSVHRLEGKTLVEESILAPTTSRQDVVAIVPMPDARSVLLAYFDAKYTVTSVIAKRAQTWETTTVASLRTATSYARGDVDGDGAPDLVVGRVYGDDKGVDGDAFLLRPDGARTSIPSTRGLRAIAVIGSEVVMADGWHQNYGQFARGLLTRARFANGTFTTELIEDTAGQTSIEKIAPAMLGGQPAIVTLGSSYVRVFRRDGATWRGLTIAGAARDIAVGDLDGVAGDEILVIGDKAETIQLSAAK